MEEYIEKKALKRAIRKVFHDLGMRIDINSVINIQPTADVVKVVRCRDCTWWKSIFSWNGKEHKVCVRDSSEPPREQNDFCSYGERREDDK